MVFSMCFFLDAFTVISFELARGCPSRNGAYENRGEEDMKGTASLLKGLAGAAGIASVVLAAAGMVLSSVVVRTKRSSLCMDTHITGLAA